MMLGVLENKVIRIGSLVEWWKKLKNTSTRRSRVGVEEDGGGMVLGRTTRMSVSHIKAGMNVAEATRVGRTFAMFIVTNTQPSAAVDAWRLDNKSILPLFELPFFRPMMDTIACELLKTSNFGLRLRVGAGALLSIGDMISDIIVIRSYFAAGNTAAANALLSMLITTQVYNLILVFGINFKKPKKVVMGEVLWVFSGLKPAVDAYRVAMGVADDKSSVNPLVEMSMGKCGELAIESIPGSLLQVYTYINSPTKSTFHLISIAISTLTTGFASALISFDMETSVANRKEVPLFYGYCKGSNFER